MPSRNLYTVYLCGHVVHTTEPIPAGGILHAAKRIFTSPPTMHYGCVQPCPNCQGMQSSLAKQAPPALGHQETLAVIALGGATSAVDKLKQIQEDNRKVIARQSKLPAQAQVAESSATRQQKVQADLDRATEFWKEFHASHGPDETTGNEGSWKCSEMARILSDPDYRSKTPYNDKFLRSSSEGSEINQRRTILSSYIETAQDTPKLEALDRQGQGSQDGLQDELEAMSVNVHDLRRAGEFHPADESQEVSAENTDSSSSDFGFDLARVSPRRLRTPLPPPSVTYIEPLSSVTYIEDTSFPEAQEMHGALQETSEAVEPQSTEVYEDQEYEPQYEPTPNAPRYLIPNQTQRISLSPYTQPGAALFDSLRKYFSLPEKTTPADLKRFFKRPFMHDKGPHYRRPRHWGVGEETYVKLYNLMASNGWLATRSDMFMACKMINWLKVEDVSGFSPDSSSSYYSDDNKEAESEIELQIRKYHEQLINAFPNMGEDERDDIMLRYAQKLYATQATQEEPPKEDATQAAQEEPPKEDATQAAQEEPSKEDESQAAQEEPSKEYEPQAIQEELTQEDKFKAQERAFDEEYKNAAQAVPVREVYLGIIYHNPSISEGRLPHRPEFSSRLRKQILVLERVVELDS